MWGRLFKVETEEELRMLMETSEDMRVAGEKLLELSADQEAQAIAEARRLAIWERNDIIVSTDKLARKEEREKADAEKAELLKKTDAEKAELLKKNEEDKLNTAKRLLAMGLSPEEVAEGADLDYNVVCKLM